jgi:hypothetical protein
VPVERRGFARASSGAAAGRFGVVVGVAGNPLKPERGVPQDELDDFGAPVEEGVAAFGRDDVPDDRFEVLTRQFGGVFDPGGLERRVVRDPHAAARAGRGAAEPGGLFDDDDAQAQLGGGQCGGHAGSPTACHDDVELLRHATSGRAEYGTRYRKLAARWPPLWSP